MGDAVLELLARGAAEVLGRLPYSSNYTFLARVRAGHDEALAVYKPSQGERPLWDFPHGSLAGREVAAYVVSQAGGWDLVPPTLLRRDAPLGPGSLQAFIEHDPERHYFTFMEQRAEDLRALAAFDVVVNNADRKAGHVLEDASGRLWAVDHGVTFHVEPKLRTVIWAFAGDPLGDAVRARLERLGTALEDGDAGRILREVITEDEVDATLARVEALLVEDRFPPPGDDRPLPWPLI